MFLKIGAVHKDIKVKEKFSDNHVNNIMGLFNALPNFLFTTSETNWTINSKQGICELHHKLPNDLWLRNLGQIRKISLEL